MDERMKQELDHYLTTPPEEDMEEEELCVDCGEPAGDGESLCPECLALEDGIEDDEYFDDDNQGGI